MSMKFWDSAVNRVPLSKEQEEADKVKGLYQLGLLSNPEKKKPRRTKDKDREQPGGGAHVAGSQ